MSDGVQIELDKASARHLDLQLDKAKLKFGNSVYKASVAIAYRIKALAQQRLKSRNHIITSRLRNSLFVKSFDRRNQNRIGNEETYTWDGGSGNRDLNTVEVGKDQVAVGTNVEYGGFIEFKDSFLYWALKNTDIEKTLKQNIDTTSKL